MCKTIVITTTEQAKAFLQHLDRVAEAVKLNDYASERAKPIRTLTCTCCGSSYQGRQWWNQDCGYGLGDCCVEYCGVKPNGGESRSFGVPGIHFLIDLGWVLAPMKQSRVTIRNTNERLGDPVEFSGDTLEDAVTEFQACMDSLGYGEVTKSDYEILENQ